MADKTVGQLTQTTDVVGSDLAVVWRPTAGPLKATTVTVFGQAIFTALGVGSAAYANIGTTAGTVAAGNDARFSNGTRPALVLYLGA